jgi:hypothetical protein
MTFRETHVDHDERMSREHRGVARASRDGKSRLPAGRRDAQGSGGEIMNRRGFLRGVAGFLAAPAIVRASSIMPVSAMPNPISYLGVASLKIEGTSLTFDYLTSDYAWFLCNATHDPREAWLRQRARALDLFNEEPEV